MAGRGVDKSGQVRCHRTRLSARALSLLPTQREKERKKERNDLKDIHQDIEKDLVVVAPPPRCLVRLQTFFRRPPCLVTLGKWPTAAAVCQCQSRFYSAALVLFSEPLLLPPPPPPPPFHPP